MVEPTAVRWWVFRAEDWEGSSFHLGDSGEVIHEDDAKSRPFSGTALSAAKEARRRNDDYQELTGLNVETVYYASLGRTGDLPTTAVVVEEERLDALGEFLVGIIRAEKKATQGKWVVGGAQHEDWGVVRDSAGKPIASTAMEAQHPGGFEAFRNEVPFGSAEHNRGPELIAGNAELIVLARNNISVLAQFALAVVVKRTVFGTDGPTEAMLNDLANALEVPK